MNHNGKMTRAEAECYKAAKYWQRQNVWRKLRIALRPSTPMSWESVPRILRIFFTVVLLPFTLALWLLTAVFAMLILPFQLFATYTVPRTLRGPGERNIQGVHYSFSRFMELPPDLYLRCVDDWIAILYGREKLAQYSIQKLLDTKHLLRKEILNSRDRGVLAHLHQQINFAREEVSRELGHYR